MEPITDEERRRDAELEALRLKITEEDTGHWDRLADRTVAEDSIPMEELLGLPPDEEDSRIQFKPWLAGVTRQFCSDHSVD
jgi:hypothetical protein